VLCCVGVVSEILRIVIMYTTVFALVCVTCTYASRVLCNVYTVAVLVSVLEVSCFHNYYCDNLLDDAIV
jgi:hypothetical protein